MCVCVCVCVCVFTYTASGRQCRGTQLLQRLTIRCRILKKIRWPAA